MCIGIRLVYRFEKIQKRFGLDLRSFEDALTFKIAMLVSGYLRGHTNPEGSFGLRELRDAFPTQVSGASDARVGGTDISGRLAS